MHFTFHLLCLATLASAIAAMTLRNLVHCALCLMVTFGGLAAIYLNMHAQFIALAQLLVYVGAVGILIIFAILLTRGSDTPPQDRFSRSWVIGLAAVVLALGTLSVSTQATFLHEKFPPDARATSLTVREIGTELMTRYVLPLEILGLLLTAAMLGAVILALRDRPQPSTEDQH